MNPDRTWILPPDWPNGLGFKEYFEGGQDAFIDLILRFRQRFHQGDYAGKIKKAGNAADVYPADGSGI